MSRRERDAQNAIRIREENINTWLAQTLASPLGRDFLWWAYVECGSRDPLTMQTQGGASDTHMTFRALGKHAASLTLEERCKRVHHDNWLLMLREHDGPGRREEPKEDAVEETEESES
jgi:hypothetical protein